MRARPRLLVLAHKVSPIRCTSLTRFGNPCVGPNVVQRPACRRASPDSRKANQSAPSRSGTILLTASWSVFGHGVGTVWKRLPSKRLNSPPQVPTNNWSVAGSRATLRTISLGRPSATWNCRQPFAE